MRERALKHPVSWMAVASLITASVLSGQEARAADVIPTTAPELRIEITGFEFQWHVRYPGPDGVLGTDDDVKDRQHVHVPQGRDVELVLHSRDYLYTLALPHASLKEIAVPDLTFSLRFTPEEVGSYELLGDQFCGYSHPDLMGELVVMTETDFERWSREQALPTQASAPEEE